MKIYIVSIMKANFRSIKMDISKQAKEILALLSKWTSYNHIYDLGIEAKDELKELLEKAKSKYKEMVK